GCYGIDGDIRSLILDNVNLVKYVVGKMRIYFKKDDEEDILGYGTVGLIEAAKRFDRSRGIQFNTFAVPRIRGAIIDYLRTLDVLPRSMRKKEADIKAICLDLEKRLKREPLGEEIAKELGVSVDEFHKIQTKLNFDYFVSLDNMNSDSDDDQKRSVGSIFEDKNVRDAVEILTNKEEKGLLMTLITGLPRQERLVITLYYLEDMLIKEISKVLKISESRVSQLHHKALFYLRTHFKKVYE
ncbi:MAG: FliA/WhiG family RNA polymerase sigma factor, partial [Candidatus Anammoxibacter sp.]